MNTLLQCLYLNPSFRAAIYQFEPPININVKQEQTNEMEVGRKEPEQQIIIQERQVLKGEGFVKQLQELFGRMQSGHETTLDPSPLVEVLGLSHGEQQDVHEFNNLFLTLLQEHLSTSKDERLHNLVDEQFSGELANVTQCLNCKTKSSHLSSFSDLTLQIKNQTTLQQCLEQSFLIEHLNGSNQYRCGKCASKQDAARYTELKRLPPVLNLSLVRFEFDWETMGKTKLADAIQIPRYLDMSGLLADDAVQPVAPSIIVSNLPKSIPIIPSDTSSVKLETDVTKDEQMEVDEKPSVLDENQVQPADEQIKQEQTNLKSEGITMSDADKSIPPILQPMIRTASSACILSAASTVGPDSVEPSVSSSSLQSESLSANRPVSSPSALFRSSSQSTAASNEVEFIDNFPQPNDSQTKNNKKSQTSKPLTTSKSKKKRRKSKLIGNPKKPKSKSQTKEEEQEEAEESEDDDPQEEQPIEEPQQTEVQNKQVKKPNQRKSVKQLKDEAENQTTAESKVHSRSKRRDKNTRQIRETAKDEEQDETEQSSQQVFIVSIADETQQPTEQTTAQAKEPTQPRKRGRKPSKKQQPTKKIIVEPDASNQQIDLTSSPIHKPVEASSISSSRPSVTIEDISPTAADSSISIEIPSHSDLSRSPTEIFSPPDYPTDSQSSSSSSHRSTRLSDPIIIKQREIRVEHEKLNDYLSEKEQIKPGEKRSRQPRQIMNVEPTTPKTQKLPTAHLRRQKSEEKTDKQLKLTDMVKSDENHFEEETSSKQSAAKNKTGRKGKQAAELKKDNKEAETDEKEKVKVKKTKVDPSDLTSAKRPVGSSMYQLVAVLMHKGGSAHQGHYTCDMYDIQSDSWWSFDDDTVKQYDKHFSKSGFVPLLFYAV